MTHPELIVYLKTHIEYASMSAETDRDHAKNYAYDVICRDLYHEGKEERQQTARAAARFHDGRATGRDTELRTLVELLKMVELGVDTSPQAGQSRPHETQSLPIPAGQVGTSRA